MCTGTVKKTSLRSTFAIHTSFFIVLNASVRYSILKFLWLANSFSYFKFKNVLGEPSFFSLVKLQKQTHQVPSHCAITPLSNSFRISEFIISFSLVLCCILRAQIFLGLSLDRFAIDFQFGQQCFKCPARNLFKSDLLMFFSSCDACCCSVSDPVSLDQCSTGSAGSFFHPLLAALVVSTIVVIPIIILLIRPERLS